MAFTLLSPATPEEAVRLLAAPGDGRVAALAGGTALLFELSSGRDPITRVVSLRRLPWRAVTWAGPTLTIGATAPLSAIEGDPRVRRDLPGLWMAVDAVGGVPLRHRASLGGNLARASPASDLIPILLALDSDVSLFGPRGRRSLPLGEFLRGARSTALEPAELVEAVRIPEPRASAYLWQRVRPANDISQVGVAVAYSPTADAWRVAVGGAGPSPRRLPAAEDALRGARPSPSSVDAAARAAAHSAPFEGDKRASGAYRHLVLETLVRRAVQTAGGDR